MLKIAGEAQKPYFKWLLENGVVFTSHEARPAEFEVIIKQCYNNSIRGSIYYDLEYWEGFYVTEFGIPFEHAFNVENGTVVDYTVNEFGFTVSEWFGVQIPPKILAEYISADEQFLTPLTYYYRKITENGKNRDNSRRGERGSRAPRDT